MKAQTIVVTRRCNQGCGFCDRVQHGSADPPADAVIEAIREALRGGARAIVFSGGEPMLRADLASFARVARDGGATEILLETNGTLIESEATAEASAAGALRRFRSRS
jgi:molybdenum cofactor biosynthesis enzyme MoaA